MGGELAENPPQRRRKSCGLHKKSANLRHPEIGTATPSIRHDSTPLADRNRPCENQETRLIPNSANLKKKNARTTEKMTLHTGGDR
jgi:hypothetical protein